MERNKGITLVALIITIIIMLILVAVSVNVLIKSDLIGIAEKTTGKYKTASEEEANGGTIEINGNLYRRVYSHGKVYLSDIYPSIHNTSIRLFGNISCFKTFGIACSRTNRE